jgi:predicted butyrate kinase (DUF1464 family)
VALGSTDQARHLDIAYEETAFIYVELVALVQTDDRSRLAWEAFVESVVKSIAAEMAVVPSPREILISGRLARIPEVRQELTDRLSGLRDSDLRLPPVRRVAGFAQVAKEAAQGAALIAEGLAGGVHARLVEAMELREAGGTALDHLYVAGAEMLRERYGGGIYESYGGGATVKRET